MFDPENDQAADPPDNNGGGESGTESSVDLESASALRDADPPDNTGGGTG